MKTIHTLLAEQIGEGHVEPLTIVFDQPHTTGLTADEHTVEQLKAAEEIAHALSETMPQGVRHKLTHALLRELLSDMVVSRHPNDQLHSEAAMGRFVVGVLTSEAEWNSDTFNEFLEEAVRKGLVPE